MGWLWGSDSASSAKDKLDPSLQEFLKNEAPSGQKPTLPSKPIPQRNEASKAAQTNPPSPTEPAQLPEKPLVPPESQFQDGRYAHLWKNYTPQHILDERSKTEQDKLRDIVDAYNDRKADIGRVALENCAFEYMAQFDCFRNPSVGQMATLCRDESRKFNRCYDIQSKFLKALGYLTLDKRTPEEDEKIQMHADKLYQQLLAQEALIAKAKEEGKPIPTFESVLSKQNVSRAAVGKPLIPTEMPLPPDADDENDIWAHIKPSSRKEYEKKLATLPKEDQEIERKALLGELRAQTGISKKVEETFVEERLNRIKRREAGQATFGDTIKRWWGWD
ncbi:hypothetical protein BU24DRAFT_418004 [Aaosphaeria arxii CBS 175.79]|uniref:Uncharacterized protein n=1 Tax=Aaosphaeria arxii CBS 175.79 TaxID=1450172 RepID=A0A6A5YAI3_9PLEO|nr:uncharacterized protein BU24DRAFT_418004 [Aaosphaeria arxii CBS 175.79]KAF2022359.1 hypothetical protein BU24DRAFT_418004 [Aaosphaeria arxii CBS 175.79]